MEILLIQSIDKLKLERLSFPEQIPSVFAFDVMGHFSKEDRLEATRLLKQHGIAVTGWFDDYLMEDDENTFREEIIDWLAAMPESIQHKGQNLKEIFTFKKELSLWWITKLSQKKPNKTPIYQYGRIVYRVTELIQRLEAVRPKGGYIKFENDSFLIVSTGTEVDRLIASSILSGSAFKRKRPNIYFFSRSQKGCKQEAGGILERAKAYVKRTIAAILSSISQLRKTYKGIVSTNLFLQQLYRGDQETSRRHCNSVVLLGTNVRDFETDRNDDGHLAWRSIYYDNLEQELNRAGFDPIWICLSGNRPMDRSTYRESCKYIGNDYSLLFPGWGIFLRLLLQNLSWIYLFWKVFVVHRLQDRFQFRGVNLGFLLINDYANLCFGHAAELMYHRSMFKAAYRRIRPMAVIYRKEFNAIGRLVSSSAVRGCKMISVQHGIVNNSQIGYLFRPNEVDIRNAVCADLVHHCPVPDHVVVFGKRMVEFMSSAGFPTHKIIPLGSLRHDAVVKRYLISQENGPGKSIDLLRNYRKTLQIGDGSFVILLCTQWKEFACDWFELVVRAIQRSGIKSTLFVKPHHHFPETARLIENKAAELRFSDYRIMTSDFYNLIFCSDVMVTHSSTAILDAVLLLTPVIVIRHEGLLNDNTLFTNAKVGLTAGSAEGMARALMCFYKKESNAQKWEKLRKEFLEYHFGNVDARAMSRLIEVIKGEECSTSL